MNLRKKLIILVVLPLIVIFATNGFTLYESKATTNSLIGALYDKTFVPSAVVLNADRDMYQALVAQRTLIHLDNNDKLFATQVKAYKDNIAQVKERLEKARMSFESDSTLRPLKNPTSQRTLPEEINNFNKQFGDWEKESNSIVDAVSKLPLSERTELIAKAVSLDSTFEVSRNNLNEIEETLETFATTEMQTTKQDNSRLFLMLIAIIVLFSIVIISFNTFFIHTILQAIRKIAMVTEKVAQGDLSIEKLTIKSKDEIGRLGMSVNTMVERLRELISNILSTGTYVVDSSNQLKLSSEETSKASEQISLTIQEVAIGSEKQSSSLLESSRIIEEISSNVEHIMVNVHQASQSSEAATKVASSGEFTIQSLIQTMTEISDNVKGLVTVVKGLGNKSSEIEQIVGVINQIANQTNLLALNAAIEAARAGEHGRGFAVVADEVKKLAEQSESSTQEITHLILSIQQETHKTIQSTENVMGVVTEGRNSVEEAGTSFEQIRHSIEEVAGQIKGITDEINQINLKSEIVTQSSKNNAQIAEDNALGAQSVSAASEEQLAAMEEVYSSVTELSSTAERLKSMVQEFKL